MIPSPTLHESNPQSPYSPHWYLAIEKWGGGISRAKPSVRQGTMAGVEDPPSSPGSTPSCKPVKLAKHQLPLYERLKDAIRA